MAARQTSDHVRREATTLGCQSLFLARWSVGLSYLPVGGGKIIGKPAHRKTNFHNVHTRARATLSSNAQNQPRGMSLIIAIERCEVWGH